MKSEFVTPKDLEKLRVELASKAGGGKLDPTHPDMGPIMDSLIMTSQSYQLTIQVPLLTSSHFKQMTDPTLTAAQPPL